MPRTLLIFPPSTVFEGDPTSPAITPPLGLAYLAAYLEKYGFPVKILDAVAEGGKRNLPKKQAVLYGLSDNQIAERIGRYNPEIIGISCLYTAYAGDAHRVAAVAKKVNPKILVVFGGAHATIFPELTLKDKNIDQVVMGEGEVTLLALVKAMEEKADLGNIPGTVVRAHGKIIKNFPREPIKNLDDIPLPAWHLLPVEKYLRYPDYCFSMRTPGLPMITSRGCPGHCIYCSIHSVWGHTWRGRSPENVVTEMELLQKKYGIREIFFFDDSMGADKKRLTTICDEIIKRKIDIKWLNPNVIAHLTLDEKLLEKMKAAGCYRITFGIESGNKEIRKFIGKPYDLGQAKRMIKHANKIGLWTICTNIIGFPDETKSQIEETFKFAVNSDTDLAIFYLLCPHPGTRVYEIFKKEGLLDLDYIFTPNRKYASEDFSKVGRVLAGKGVRTNNFSEQELQQTVSDIYKRFIVKRIFSFSSPLRLLRKIRSFEDFKYILKIGRNLLLILIRLARNRSFSSQALRKDLN